MKKIALRLLLLSTFILNMSIASFAGVDTTGGASTQTISCGTTDDVFKENAAMSISFWIYYRGAGGGGDGRIFERTDSVSTFFALYSPGSRILLWELDGGTEMDRETNGSFFTLNAWQNIIITWDGSTTATNVHMYNNNVEATYALSNNGATPTDTASSTLRMLNGDGANRANDGMVDEVYIFSAVLNATDRAILANSHMRGAGLHLSTTATRYYPLDDQADGVSSNVTYVDRGTSKTNCTGSNSPTGKAGVISSYRP